MAGERVSQPARPHLAMEGLQQFWEFLGQWGATDCRAAPVATAQLLDGRVIPTSPMAFQAQGVAVVALQLVVTPEEKAAIQQLVLVAAGARPRLTAVLAAVAPLSRALAVGAAAVHPPLSRRGMAGQS